MPKSSEFLIQTHELQFSYNHLAVLNGFDLEVPAGSIFGFLGPNGAGKSTTIKALLGLLQVQDGMISLFGKEINNHRIEILSKIGAMVEAPSMYDHLSARRNLEITQRLRGIAVARINEVLDIVDLTSDADRQVRQFSTGMKQRLSLAAALMGKPELLILDEPINGLDPSGILEIRNLLNRLNREEGCTVFLSSHILDEIEKLCPYVAVIQSGKLLFQGDTSTLLKKYGGNECLLIETNNNQEALSKLAGKEASLEGNRIRVTYQTREDAARVIRLLTESGIDVYSAGREQNDLESSFLELLQEGGEK